MISPKRRSKNVSTTVMTKNSNKTEVPKSMTSAKKKLHNMIIITLTKLLEIRMVANKRSESANKSLMYLSEECSSSSTSFKSLGDKEKNAISDADTKPEANNNNTANEIAIMAPMEGAVTVTPSNNSAKRHKNESGSKE